MLLSVFSYLLWGGDSEFGISTVYGLDDQSVRTPVFVKYIFFLYTHSGAHQASSTVGTGSVSGG